MKTLFGEEVNVMKMVFLLNKKGPAPYADP
jgi:hypothetical protein